MGENEKDLPASSEEAPVDGGTAVEQPQDAPTRGAHAPIRGAHAPMSGAGAVLARDGSADGRLSAREIAAFLGLKDTQKRLRVVAVAFCAPKTPAFVVEDVWQDANVAALSSRWRPRSRDALLPWAKTIVRRAAANYFRREAVHGRWLHRDVEADDVPAAEEGPPLREPLDTGVEDGLLDSWLEERVARSVRDAETLDLIRYKARGDKTWEEVAAEWDTSPSALHNRVHKLKKKYLPMVTRYREERRRVILLVALGLGAVALVVAAAWLSSRPRLLPIGPDLYEPVKPTPSASVSVPLFHQAAPTDERPDDDGEGKSPKPPKGPKP
jgi:DNA-directed RNA polymerase specialized sigma24 family protein